MSSATHSDSIPDQVTDSVDLRSLTVDQLILGRAIQHPIYDQHGVLLLAEGSIVNENFKLRLRERKIRSVKVHESDAEMLTFRIDDSHKSVPETTDHYKSSISKQLRHAVTTNLPFVNNDGPALKESAVFHGCNAYNRMERDKLLREQQQHSQTLLQQMQKVAAGEEVSGKELGEIVSNSIKHMSGDSSCFSSLGYLMSRDRSLVHHCQRMSNLSMSMAMEMGLNSENVTRVGMTGLLHDWGMLRIPHVIRDPQQPPNLSEQLEIEKHCGYSVDMLDKIPHLPTLVTLLTYQVHERIDGTGYPRRKAEHAIHLLARILHIAHEFCFMTTATRYRVAYSPFAAMSMLLRDDRGQCRDPLIMRCLLRVYSLFPIGTYVNLSDGSMGRVIRPYGDQYSQPVVELTESARGERVAPGTQTIELANTELTISQVLPTPGRQELTRPYRRTDESHWQTENAQQPWTEAPQFMHAKKQHRTVRAASKVIRY
jgi:HD-GYP domain-containing protein (c-di-GMP phosphodiesterase class II)